MASSVTKFALAILIMVLEKIRLNYYFWLLQSFVAPTTFRPNIIEEVTVGMEMACILHLPSLKSVSIAFNIFINFFSSSSTYLMCVTMLSNAEKKVY